MKNLATLLSEAKEANKNLVKFIKQGNEQAALMWAEKLQKIENEIESL